MTVEIDDELEFSTDVSDELDVDQEIVSSDDVADIDFDLNDDDDQELDVGDLQEVSGLEVDEDYDELRTQYELAKVFADLGDEDGARKILSDIIADDSAEETLVSDSKKLLATIS